MPDVRPVSSLAWLPGALAGAASGRRRDGWSLTTHLALLAIAIMVPLLFLAGLGLQNHIDTARQGLYQDAQRMADNLAANLDREMTSVFTLLNVLSQDTAFDRQEYGTLYARAKEGLKGRKGYAVLFGLGPKALFSTRFAYGEPLPDTLDDGTGELVMQTRLPQVSNLFYGRAAQRQLFIAAVPILREGQVVGRLQLALEPQDLAAAIMPVGINPAWGYSIADRNFLYIISSDPRSYQTGQPVQRDIVAHLRGDAGQFRAGEGRHTQLIAYRKSALMGWTALTSAPLALAEQPLTQVWRRFTLIGAAAFTLSLIAAYALSRAMSRPIQQLTGSALEFAQGKDIPILHSTLREANLLSCAFSDAASQLRGRTAALAESERRLRLFAEQTHDAIWFVDLDKRGVAYVSPAFEAISGLASDTSVDMDRWRASVHPDDLAAFDQRFAGPLNETVQCEYRIVRPDHQLRWVLDMRFPLELADGKPRIVAGILRDITHRQEAVAALKGAQAEAEARLEELENLYSSAPTGLALMDSHCRLLRLNTALADMAGLSRADYAGKPFFEMFPQLAAMKAQCDTVLRTGVPVKNLELELRRSDSEGSQYLLAHCYPVQVKNGAFAGIGVILENFTERKRTEQVLARLAAIVYAANDAMFSFAPTGRIQNWNPAAENLFHYNQAEAIDHSFAMLFPEGRDDDFQELIRAREAGDSLRLNTELRRKDGSLFPASVSIAPIKEAERIVAISTTIEDITDRRRSEKRQLLMNRELSHRVKNSLAVIQAMARHTLRSSPDPAAFTAAFEGRLRALAISHNLLTTTHWEGADLSELAREQLAPNLQSNGRLRLDGPKLLLPPGTATSLGLVLHELGTNALKYGALSVPGGSVGLTWRILPSNPHRTLAVEWTERGGPAVKPPERRGFGSVLIDNSGNVERHYEPEGLRCTIEMPLMEQASPEGI